MNASRTGYDYKLGSQVSYNCHHGYTIVGGDTITCVMGNDGKPVWDRALPSCKGRRDTSRTASLQTPWWWKCGAKPACVKPLFAILFRHKDYFYDAYNVQLLLWCETHGPRPLCVCACVFVWTSETESLSGIGRLNCLIDWQLREPRKWHLPNCHSECTCDCVCVRDLSSDGDLAWCHVDKKFK